MGIEVSPVIISEGEGKKDSKNIAKNKSETREEGGVFLHCDMIIAYSYYS